MSIISSRKIRLFFFCFCCDGIPSTHNALLLPGESGARERRRGPNLGILAFLCRAGAVLDATQDGFKHFRQQQMMSEWKSATQRARQTGELCATVGFTGCTVCVALFSQRNS